VNRKVDFKLIKSASTQAHTTHIVSSKLYGYSG